MDDYSQYLVAQSRSGAAALHEFMLRFNEDGRNLHFFFEGEEDPGFFLPQIRRLASAHAHCHYVCGGKWEVGKVRDYLVANDYPLDNIMFFVDRDFDDLLDRQISADPKCYITDYYSIESHLVGSDQAEMMLVELAGVAQSDRDCVAFIGSFSDVMQQYYDAIKPFMALTIAARDSGIKVNLNNAKLGDMFVISVQERRVARKRGALNSFVKSVFPKDASLTRSAVAVWLRRISEFHPKLWVRGKYELWFFEQIILAFLEDMVARRRAAKQKVPRVPSALREGALVDVLGGRIPTPQTLVRFVRNSLPSAA